MPEPMQMVLKFNHFGKLSLKKLQQTFLKESTKDESTKDESN